jgi:hypothetical protein
MILSSPLSIILAIKVRFFIVINLIVIKLLIFAFKRNAKNKKETFATGSNLVK